MTDEDWLYRHRVMRRLVLLWACWLITMVSLEYTGHIGKANTADGVIITAIVGILSAVIGFQKRDK
jgi:hypothetical protein